MVELDKAIGCNGLALFRSSRSTDCSYGDSNLQLETTARCVDVAGHLRLPRHLARLASLAGGSPDFVADRTTHTAETARFRSKEFLSFADRAERHHIAPYALGRADRKTIGFSRDRRQKRPVNTLHVLVFLIQLASLFPGWEWIVPSLPYTRSSLKLFIGKQAIVQGGFNFSSV